MPSYNKYLINGISINLILYYLITISIPVINILTAFTALISLFLYPFNNSFASDLSDKKPRSIFFSNTILLSLLSFKIFPRCA